MTESTKRTLKHLGIASLIFLAFGIFAFIAFSQDEAPLGEPFEARADDSSLMYLDEDPELNIDEEILNNQIDLDDLENQEESDEEDPEESDEENSEKSDEQQDQQSNDKSQNDTDQSKDKKSDASTGGKNKKHGNTKDNGSEKDDETYNQGSETDLTYFRTTIKDGETVSEPNYEFEIIHTDEVKKQKLTPGEIHVIVNGQEVPQFVGKVVLDEGENKIRVVVDYVKEDGTIKKVGKNYTVFLNQEDLVITDTIQESKVVYNPVFNFKAYATYDGKKFPAEVYLNGYKVDGNDEDYSVDLVDGDNKIEIAASYFNKEAESKEYVITLVSDPFSHNLQNQEVDTMSFNFHASLRENMHLSEFGYYEVQFNGHEITNDTGDYSVELSNGKNTISLIVNDSKTGLSYEQHFNIAYNPPIDKTPTITTNLDSESVVFYPDYTVRVDAISYKGSSIMPSTGGTADLEVYLNDNLLPSNIGSTIYQVAFTLGMNELKVVATDNEGNVGTYIKTVEYRNPNPDPIGHVLLSVEASTVGLSNFIAPSWQPIYEGDTTAKVVARALEDYGYQYTSPDPVDSKQFYLSSIITGGDIKTGGGYRIPAGLVEEIDNSGTVWTSPSPDDPDNPGKHGHYALGEFDYTRSSGWIYLINGAFPEPNVGMGQRTPQDGEEIRVCFTIHNYGQDVLEGY